MAGLVSGEAYRLNYCCKTIDRRALIMSMGADNAITGLLALAKEGDSRAFEELWLCVYAELHRVAENQLRGEYATAQLAPTELIHEAFMRLMPNGNGHFENRRQFFAAAARAMRRIRVDDARKRGRLKRGGSMKLGVLSDETFIAAQNPNEVLAVDEAMATLAKLDPAKADVVNLRYFSGFTVNETAEALGISPRKVNLEWKLARAWLHRALLDGADTASFE